MENRRFTDTELPVFSGGEGWYQHIHIVQAIVKSNGWPDETAALQLFVHLKGEALDVALLLKKKACDTIIRDKFIAGQEQCALRRQLDGFAQDTPIGEIVDSCRVWDCGETC